MTDNKIDVGDVGEGAVSRRIGQDLLDRMLKVTRAWSDEHAAECSMALRLKTAALACVMAAGQIAGNDDPGEGQLAARFEELIKALGHCMRLRTMTMPLDELKDVLETRPPAPPSAN